MKKKTFNPILLVALIFAWAFTGTTILAGASPKAEFYIVYNLTSHTRTTNVDNDQVWKYEMSQTANISESTVLLDEGIVGGRINFNWLVVHNKQSDVACGSGTFEIASIEGVVLIIGRVMAEVTGFSTSTPIVEVTYLGHGYMNIKGITEDIGFQIVITIEGYYW